MIPAEFSPDRHATLYSQRTRACPPASMSEYEVLNDIIRHLAIEDS
jgi:hypothetical protein